MYKEYMMTLEIKAIYVRGYENVIIGKACWFVFRFSIWTKTFIISIQLSFFLHILKRLKNFTSNVWQCLNQLCCLISETTDFYWIKSYEVYRNKKKMKCNIAWLVLNDVRIFILVFTSTCQNNNMHFFSLPRIFLFLQQDYLRKSYLVLLACC